ncbi:MAG: hypothetical protein AB7F98_06180 [Novosphingobium sp.]
MPKRTIALIAVAAMLSGCAFHRQLREVAVDHNQLLADTEDRLALLNVVRAEQRFPMHFSTITTLRGGASVTTGAELGASFPESGLQTINPKLSGSMTTNPSFDMVALNNEKFQRGIQQPVKTEFVEYLLQQGWKDDLVMALLIEKIEIRAAKDYADFRKGDLITSMLNANADPASQDEEEEAEARMWRCFLHASRMTPRKTPSKTVDLVDLEPVLRNSSIGDVITLDGKTFDIGASQQDAARQTIQRKNAARTALGFVRRGFGTLPGECEASNQSRFIELIERPATEPVAQPARPTTGKGRRGPPALPAPDAPSRNIDAQAGLLTFKGKTYEVDLVPVLRSTQGVIYFLGEYSRPAPAGRYSVVSGKKLFGLERGQGPAAVEVRFRGERWFIRDGDGSSLQILDAIQQLLNLQKSSDELPFTQTVTVVR